MNNSKSNIEHYDTSYFEWQKQIGEFGAKANLFKFQPHIKSTDRVLDFGCGGGFLLAALTCGEKIGVEINSTARAHAAKLGVKTFGSPDEVLDQWADVIISNSALEHVENPLIELKRLKTKLRPGGLVVFSIPHESLTWRYRKDDINCHLYTWSPMSGGHLFLAAGYDVLGVELVRRMWPPNAKRIFSIFGERLFAIICTAYHFIRAAFATIKPIGVDSAVVVVATKND